MDFGDLDPKITEKTSHLLEQYGTKETEKIQINEIKKIISSRSFKGNMQYLIGKANRLWGDGLYLVDLEVIHRGNDYNKCYLLSALYQNNIVRTPIYYFSQSMQYVLTFLVFVSSAFLCMQSHKHGVWSMSVLSLVGVSTFLIFIWEIRSRYLFNMFPLICLSSVIALFKIDEVISLLPNSNFAHKMQLKFRLIK